MKKDIKSRKSIALITVFSLLLIIGFYFWAFDLSDPLKENIVLGKISKKEALEIGYHYMNGTKIYAYRVDQHYVDTTTSGKEISKYVWSVDLYVIPHFLRNTKYYSLLIDIETGEIIESAMAISKW